MGTLDDPRNTHFSNMHSIAMISLLSSSSMVAQAFVVAPSSPAATAATFTRPVPLGVLKPHMRTKNGYSSRPSSLSSTSGSRSVAVFSTDVSERRLRGWRNGKPEMQFFSFGGGSTTDEQQVKEDSVSITRRGRLRQQMVTSIKGHSSKHVQPPPSEKASPLAGAVEGEEDKRLKSKEKSNFSPRKHGSPDSKGALSSKKDARAPESNSNNVVSGRGLTIPIPIQIPSITDGWNMFGGTGNSTAAVEISAAAAHATNGTRTDLNRRKASYCSFSSVQPYSRRRLFRNKKYTQHEDAERCRGCV